jgi:anti-anti-sigma factor
LSASRALTKLAGIPPTTEGRHELSSRDSLLPLDRQFTASVEIGEDQAIICFGGELDLASHEACRRYLEEIAALADGTIVFDLSRLSFIDGAGILTLAESARRLSATRPVRFVIPPQGHVRRLVDLLQSIDGELFYALAEAPSASTSELAAVPLTAPPRGSRFRTRRSRRRRSLIVIPAAETERSSCETGAIR